TVTHLVIADRLLKPLDIQNPPLFYCCNLAPDAIMARENYRREMKRHTHFKDDIRLNDLHLPEYYQRYRRTFRLFTDQYLRPGAPDYELYLGYVTHMLADEVFILTVRDAHVRKLAAQGLTPDDPAYFTAFGQDVDLNDWRLVREYAFQYPMPDILLAEQDYEIRNYITCQELQSSKAFIIRKNFLTPHEESAPGVFSFSENQEFIENACLYIQKAIRDWI
ncbi:MAG: hypothetical protein K2O34_05800, partial [Acetatifactor sp.]|nr:hypothetical protein [Acetatifactor sp.]